MKEFLFRISRLISVIGIIAIAIITIMFAFTFAAPSPSPFGQLFGVFYYDRCCSVCYYFQLDIPWEIHIMGEKKNSSKKRIPGNLNATNSGLSHRPPVPLSIRTV